MALKAVDSSKYFFAKKEVLPHDHVGGYTITHFRGSCIIYSFHVTSKGKGKGKTVPLQAWSGPEGSRKLRFPDFVTKAQDDGKVVSLTHRPHLPPGNSPGTHFC
jgi:hypothetical protein